MTLQSQIEAILSDAFKNEFVSVQNDSHKHAVPKGAETHFLIEVISEQFAGQSLLKRHRLVQQLLKEVTPMVKAISLHTFTKSERENTSTDVIQSPNCKGNK